MVNPKKVEKFGKWALKLRAEAEEREKNPRDPRYDRPRTSGHGYLMAAIYLKGREKIAADKVDQIKLIAKELGQSASGMKEENPFEWVFAAFCGALGPVDDAMRAKSKRLSLQMFYAHIHKVDSEELMTFIYAAGGYARIRRRLKQSHPDLFARRRKRRPRRPTAADRARQKREMDKRLKQVMETPE